MPDAERRLPSSRRVALVHDWLNGMRGGEKVFEHFCALFPDATVFTLLYEPDRVSDTIRAMDVRESPFVRIPGARRSYRTLLPLMPHFVRRLPTQDFDLVISTSHCVAKAAPPPRRGVHLSYVFSPMRYVWDHYEDYLGENPVKNAALAAMRRPLQHWDRTSNAGVRSFAADSAHIAAKIAKFWGRKARVILPPVEERYLRSAVVGRQPAVASAQDQTPQPSEDDLRRAEVARGGTADRRPTTDDRFSDYFLVVSALVPYKKVDRAIAACRMARAKLVVVGDGPERRRLEAMKGGDTQFLGWVPDDELAALYRGARALLYPGIEDFGITALEAQACGRPVLGLRGGGLLETVVEGVTGRFFDEPTAESLARVLKAHDDGGYDPDAIRRHAAQFSAERFRAELLDWIDSETRFAP